MDENGVYKTLLEADVITGDQNTRLSSSFIQDIEGYNDLIDNLGKDGLTEVLRESGTPQESVHRFLKISGVDSEYLARYLALQKNLQKLEFEKVVQLSVIVNELERPEPPTSGSPDAFYPIHGDKLRTYMTLYPIAIVYAWRENCPPCDTVRQAFDDVFQEPRETISLFSVYGPDCAETLRDEFDATVAPTTLFCIEGTVDSRLQGAHYEEVLRGEVEQLCESAQSRNLI